MIIPKIKLVLSNNYLIFTLALYHKRFLFVNIFTDFSFF
nr:MAG TPA: hypothetical protein [Caudoviricetes sp.]